jgi:hypothetical protein
MNTRRLFAAVVLAMLVAVVLTLPASAAPLATLEANMTGAKEVPGPGDPNGSGHAVIKVFSARVCYTLEVRRIAPATDAHIHQGVRGVAGPIVVTLKAPTDGSTSACKQITSALSQKLREHPARYYVNIHNGAYPDGAIRGQLHRR